MLTLEELERRAYISGNTQLAAAIGATLALSELATSRGEFTDGDDEETFWEEENLRFRLAHPAGSPAE